MYVYFATMPQDFSIKQLAQKTTQTLWNKLPLRSIAEAHKREAEYLVSRGSLDNSPANKVVVLLEYYKYLQLHLDQDGPEYHRIAKRVYQLEQSLNTTAPDRLSSASESYSTEWKFFALGLATASIVSFFVRRASKRR
ncbi:hypothetical protein DFH08DRAFT_827086 [Mycena albidolilacea]|uniref:Uncharacterized protein n=1 Tax=Mycena albidolilacea TaxID=1033008 RepID=A0AAD6YYW2_9AGAR|nr:hypothetical protein DFH08DRAFT_827086 [Mycena albidolilacea]